MKIDRRLVDEAGSAAKAKSSGTASSWATLVKRVFEVDPLQCPQCGSRMKVVSFIKRCQRDVVEKILRHCGWREGLLRMLATAGLYPTQRTWIETHLSRMNSSWFSIQSSFSEHLSRPQTGVGCVYWNWNRYH